MISKIALFQEFNKVFFNLTGFRVYPVKSRLHEIRDDDVLLASYPRSGSTWLRFIIANIVTESDEPLTFDTYKKYVPSLDDFKVNRDAHNASSPRILKSHDVFDPRYKRVVYLVRDPRSVAVSFYFLLKRERKIDNKVSFIDFFPEFIDGNPAKGLFSNYGSWGEHVGSWVGAIGGDEKRFLMVKYEDLKANTYAKTNEIINFLGITASDEKIKKSIEFSSLEMMKKFSDQKIELHKKLKIDTSIPFVRKASNDEWKDYFDSKSLELLYKKFEKQIIICGYEFSAI
jgi:hypothetical protein